MTMRYTIHLQFQLAYIVSLPVCARLHDARVSWISHRPHVSTVIVASTDVTVTATEQRWCSGEARAKPHAVCCSWWQAGQADFDKFFCVFAVARWACNVSACAGNAEYSLLQQTKHWCCVPFNRHGKAEGGYTGGDSHPSLR